MLHGIVGADKAAAPDAVLAWARRGVFAGQGIVCGEGATDGAAVDGQSFASYGLGWAMEHLRERVAGLCRRGA